MQIAVRIAHGARSVESEHHVSWLQDFTFDIAETADIAQDIQATLHPLLVKTFIDSHTALLSRVYYLCAYVRTTYIRIANALAPRAALA